MTAPSPTPTEIVKPLPCPFCGDAAVSFQTKDGNWHVSCEGQIDEECRGIDSGELDGFLSEEFALEAWNRRPASGAEAIERAWDEFVSTLPDSMQANIRDAEASDGKIRQLTKEAFWYAAQHLSPRLAPFEKLVEELRDWADKYEDADNTVQTQIANRLSAVVEEVRGK